MNNAKKIVSSQVKKVTICQSTDITIGTTDRCTPRDVIAEKISRPLKKVMKELVYNNSRDHYVLDFF